MRRILIILAALTVVINAEMNSSNNQLTVQPYGFFKFDMSYDSDRISTGNFTRWVLPHSSNDAIPTTNLTVKESRFGMINKKNSVKYKYVQKKYYIIFDNHD